MKPRPGSLRHRLRLFLYHCGAAFERFAARPRVRRFGTVTAHLAPLIAVLMAAYAIAREFLPGPWSNPVIVVVALVLFIAMVLAQLVHIPETCPRCQRRMPWGKDRIHAGRAALMASHHAGFKIELVVTVVLVVLLLGDVTTLTGWLAWAENERVRAVAQSLLLIVLLGWIGQARMTHRIYQRACKRCRGKRRGGGPEGDGGEPVPLPLELPHRKNA